jgi:putative methionine-R-sulfoxide reductase with GAF domain/anti-sigma regulatory factor (Ser/Thr protein kinase)
VVVSDPIGRVRALPPRPVTETSRAKAEAETEESVRDIKSITHASLERLDVDELLPFLLDRVLELLECDTAAVLLFEPDSQHLVARAARGLEEEVRQGVRIPIGTGFAGRIAAERRPVVLEAVDPTTVANPILWEKGIHSMLGVPLVTGGTLVGVLHVGSFTQRTFDDNAVMLLELVADKVAGSVLAGLAESEHRAARVLQRSLLPSVLPVHPHMEFASRYAPAERGGVGGDWFDAFELPSGDVWVMTGDVAGHGLQPAVVMGRLRSALRAYALLGMSPEDVIRGANRKLLQFEPGAMATVTCAVLAPPFDEIRMCSAGHLPPVLVDPGGPPRLLESKPVPPLGVVDELEPHSTRWPVVDGSVLVLYTDGLVERRGESLTEGLERLRTAVHVAAPGPLCGRLMDDLVGSYVPADDIALLALRVHPAARRREPPAADSAHAAVPATSVLRSELFACDPSSVPAARRFIGECVEQLGLASLPLVQLLVSELATNAVVHARSCFDVTVEKSAGGCARVEVRDFGGGTPRLLDREPIAVSGRGLQIVASLARSWGVEQRPAGTGKSTWFTVAA